MAYKLTLQEFISRARQVHGDKYEYSKVVYLNAHINITITCQRHGDFEQEPTNHIHNKRGCPTCAYGGTDEERFWGFVNLNGIQVPYVDGRCWEWQAGLRGNGYGGFWVNDKSIPAHRYSYKLEFGEFSDDLFVLHKCDNRICVRPTHLFLGTHQDNMDDKISKGRDANQKGESNPRSIFSDTDIIKIRQLHSTGKYKQKDIATIFNRPLSTINQIITGKRWKHLLP